MNVLRSTCSYEGFGVPSPFDPNFHYVTSPVFSPIILGTVRSLFAVYALATTISSLVFSSIVLNDANLYFSYFTELSYIGLVAYFWAAAIQTFAFALRGRKSYPLQTWPRFLQLLHVILFSTVVVFPIIVTAVFWSLLASATSLQGSYNTWDNISLHMLNSGFALFEIFFTHGKPSPWAHIAPLLVVLGLYLGLAYVTHATQGFYAYSFLDPHTNHGLLAAYILGITLGCCLLFSMVKGVCHLRRCLSFRYGLFEDFSDPEALDEWQEVAAMKDSTGSEV